MLIELELLVNVFLQKYIFWVKGTRICGKMCQDGTKYAVCCKNMCNFAAAK